MRNSDFTPVKLFHHLRRAAWSAFSHSAFTNAKAAAYSAILSLFPAMLVLTTLLALSPETDSFRGDLRQGLSELLPADTMSLVQSYFQSNHARSIRLVWTSSTVMLGASMGMMLSLMESFRRAYRLPRNEWGFWHERLVAAALVPATLVPMIFASGLVAFGHLIELWMIDNADHTFQFYVILAGRILRWAIALATSIMVLGVIYHFGTPRRRRWRHVVPGAMLATFTWFLATLVYGWYLTRYADYSVVYGSLGAGVATLVWLYMVSFIILLGAEFNAQIYPLVPPRDGEA
ncbi:YihY/virulence factor BrkB family protein [Silvibacterium sp.]|uniref:YihY/virulence factor BrkB family protein n=1 Tax=Silvibacterium sp. TaxID=1964179 RepID=UPI0039E5AFCA